MLILFGNDVVMFGDVVVFLEPLKGLFKSRNEAMIKSPLSLKLSFLSARELDGVSVFFVLACCIRIGSSKGSPTETLETIAMSTDWVRFLVRNDSE